MSDAGRILGALADQDRRLVLAAVLLGRTTPSEIVDETGLDLRTVVTELGRLRDLDLVVDGRDGEWFLLETTLLEAARAARPAPDTSGDESAAGARHAEEAKVLRTFVRDGRITQIPMARGKRRVLLDRLAQEFEIGVRYTERQVNATLAGWHPDTAAWRRYLVDEGFLDRDHGEYWRSGGSVDL